MSSDLKIPCWFVVPAAGIGSRMQADCPKQYLTINNKSLLEYTLEQLLNYEATRGVVVALNENDAYWPQLAISRHEKIHTVIGGAERAHSVLAGLDYLESKVASNDWVLVHDAARPCLDLTDLEQLINSLSNDPVGGILGVPVSDTLKNVDQNLIQQTVDRQRLWQAQTPQMFRFDVLRESLQQGLAQALNITDEASAVEFWGYKARIVEGSTQNIKVTRPSDLAMAEFILSQQERI